MYSFYKYCYFIPFTILFQGIFQHAIQRACPLSTPTRSCVPQWWWWRVQLVQHTVTHILCEPCTWNICTTVRSSTCGSRTMHVKPIQWNTAIHMFVNYAHGTYAMTHCDTRALRTQFVKLMHNDTVIHVHSDSCCWMMMYTELCPTYPCNFIFLFIL